jgi:hypothetical protein
MSNPNEIEDCQSCRFREGEHIVCAVHPSGVSSDICPDYESIDASRNLLTSEENVEIEGIFKSALDEQIQSVNAQLKEIRTYILQVRDLHLDLNFTHLLLEADKNTRSLIDLKFSDLDIERETLEVDNCNINIDHCKIKLKYRMFKAWLFALCLGSMSVLGYLIYLLLSPYSYESYESRGVNLGLKHAELLYQIGDRQAAIDALRETIRAGDLPHDRLLIEAGSSNSKFRF